MVHLIQFIRGPCKGTASVLAEHFSERVLERFDTNIQPNSWRWTSMALYAHFAQLEEQKPNNWGDASLIGDGRQSPSDVFYFVESLNARLWKALTPTISSCRREDWKQNTWHWEQDSAADKPPKSHCPLCPRMHRWKIMWSNLGSSFSPFCKAIYSVNNLYDSSYSFSSISACQAKDCLMNGFIYTGKIFGPKWKGLNFHSSLSPSKAPHPNTVFSAAT